MRQKYLRQYPTLLVMPDGSSFTFRHSVPRAVVKMPLTIDDCMTAQEKADWNQRRKRLEKVSLQEDTVDVEYDKNKYLQYVQKSQSQ